VQVRLRFVVQPRHAGDAPDLDKLCRAVLDALTGVAWLDDKQVVALDARRILLGPDALASDTEGVAITLEPLP
jgi:crossover junction endodeoxyribonuclease RusA